MTRRAAKPSRLLPALAASALLFAGPVACRFFEGDRPAVIADIGGEPIPFSQFDDYVRQTLSGQPDGSDEPPGDELLSRLLDRFLDEELVVREAARRGIGVTEDEISDELRYLEGEEVTGAAAAGAESARAAARRAILLRKYRDDQVLSDIEVTDEEIASYYDEHRDQFRQPARLVLRQILLDDEDEARLLREELSREPGKFQETAEERSLAPDAGLAAAYEEANLPPEVIESIRDVPVGAISRICKSPEGVRIFLVEKRETAREVSREEATERIRILLMQERGREVYEEALASLRTNAGVVIHTASLPFRYSQ